MLELLFQLLRSLLQLLHTLRELALLLRERLCLLGGLVRHRVRATLARRGVLLGVPLIRVPLSRAGGFGGALLQRFLGGGGCLRALHGGVRGSSHVRARLAHAGHAQHELSARPALTPR